jgi:hypothetical protein
MGIITDTLEVIDGAIGTVAQQGFEAGAGSLGTTISVGASLLVALMGANVVAQIKPMSMGSFVAFGVKLSLVAIFAQSWGNFSVVYGILTDVPQSIGNSILNVTGAGDPEGLYGSLDRMLARNTEYGDAIGDSAGWVFGAFLGVVFYLIASVFAAVAAGIIAYASIMLTVMVVLAPFAIVCSMFHATSSIFDAWSRSTIGYAAMPIVTGGALGIIVAAGDQILRTAVDPDTVNEISLILPFLTIMFLSVGIMMAIPTVAQNVTGAFGLASNAAGLTNLAREGMVRTGEGAGRAAGHVGGAMTRYATGHSPSELAGAAKHGVSQGVRQHSLPIVHKTAAEWLAITKAMRAIAPARTPLPPSASPKGKS